MKFRCEVQIFIIITQRTLKKDSISSRGGGVDDVHAIGAVTLAGVVVARIANADTADNPSGGDRNRYRYYCYF